MKKYLALFVFSPLLFLINNQAVEVKADNEYQLFSKLEAEDNCSFPQISNPHASKGKLVDLGEDKSVSFPLNLSEGGTFDLLVGYFSDSSSPKIAYQIDDGSKINSTLNYSNGWGENTNTYVSEHLIEGISLSSGSHTITIYSENSGDSKYVNLDYIYLAQDRFVADGSRIQAEDCYKLGHSVEKEGGSCVDGTTLSVDGETDAKPTWNVNVPEEGTYIFQIACFTGGNDAPKYRFDFLQDSLNSQIVTLNGAASSWDRNAYSAKTNVEVNLKQGKLKLSYGYISQGFADFDYFRLFKKDLGIGKKILAEDYASGDVNLMKSPATYPFLSGHAAEIAKGKIEFKINAPAAGDYSLYMAAYTDTIGAYLKMKINGNSSNLVIDGNHRSGWIDSVNEKNLIPFGINLEAGENAFIIEKGDDSLAWNYIDVDYFFITREIIDIDSIQLDFDVVTSFNVLSHLMFDVDYELSLTNNECVALNEGVLTPIKAGASKLVVSYEIDGTPFRKEIGVSVSKGEFPNPELLKGFDTTKEYNGELQYVDVSMPEGWSCSQAGAGSGVGSYVITLTFSHADYNDVVKEGAAILTIVKGTYAGDDLYADDMKVKYDGEAHNLLASAPDGWTISYDKVDLVEPGTYEIEVTFTHPGYNDVVKTAKLTIYKGEKNNNVGPVVAISIIGGLILLGIGGFILFKKFKESHAVIK